MIKGFRSHLVCFGKDLDQCDSICLHDSTGNGNKEREIILVRVGFERSEENVKV